jgi:hypothetical protein
MRQKHLAVVMLALIFAVSCASLSVKQSVSAAHQTVRGTLVALDDFERSLCQPAPAPKSNTCTANPRIVTDAQHQQISRAFVTAYEQDIRIGQAIIAWVPGQPIPSDIPSLQATVGEIRKVVETLSPSPKVTEFFAKVDAVIAQIQDLIRKFAGGTQ